MEREFTSHGNVPTTICRQNTHRYDCPLYLSVKQKVERYIPASEDEESRWEADGDYDDLDIEKVYVGRVSRAVVVPLIDLIPLTSLNNLSDPYHGPKQFLSDFQNDASRTTADRRMSYGYGRLLRDQRVGEGFDRSGKDGRKLRLCLRKGSTEQRFPCC